MAARVGVLVQRRECRLRQIPDRRVSEALRAPIVGFSPSPATRQDHTAGASWKFLALLPVMRVSLCRLAAGDLPPKIWTR
jgi:hypothetical protein